MEPHEEDVEMLEEALKTYRRSKAASRRRKAARESGLSPIDTESTLPVTFEITNKEAAGEASGATAAKDVTA